MAKTVVKKGVVRKIKTADYEQLDVVVEEEEVLEWETEQERIFKMDEFRERFFEDVEKTYNAAVAKYGVNRCIGAVRTNSKPETHSSDSIDLDF